MTSIRPRVPIVVAKEELSLANFTQRKLENIFDTIVNLVCKDKNKQKNPKTAFFFSAFASLRKVAMLSFLHVQKKMCLMEP